MIRHASQVKDVHMVAACHSSPLARRTDCQQGSIGRQLMSSKLWWLLTTAQALVGQLEWFGCFLELNCYLQQHVT